MIGRAPGHFMAHIKYNKKKTEIRAGRTVFDYADDFTLRVATSCGRSGSCHECVVEIHEGMEALSPRTGAESFLKDSFRLACQATVQDADVDVSFSPLRREPKILADVPPYTGTLDPLIRRSGDDVFCGEHRIDSYRGRIIGVAVDLGTTTVVAEYVDLETGESITVSSFENPQRFGGSDVMFRISYDVDENKDELWKAISSSLNREIEMAADRAGFSPQDVYEIIVAGNSTMRDLFFRLDVQPIGQKPYKSTIELAYLAKERATTSIVAPANRLGIHINRNGRVFGLPIIASHVGGDTSADMIALDMLSKHEVAMLVDVGTNTEVVLKKGDRIVAASCPAGPAFEGGGVTYGMPGYEGAIESVKIVAGDFQCATIGGLPAEGLCGSGLIDLLAESRRHNLMTPKGVFSEKQNELMIVPDRGITFSRQDGSNLAQAKAANTCGELIVMRHLGVRPEDVECLYLAGGFANYVDVANAIEIGFLPPINEDRIVKVGNASVVGARDALLSSASRESAESLVDRIEHLELETTPDFFDIFVEGCQFKKMVFDY
jgi:uncharacterized 2Fe-2S/4Fe-4S cluster protein (DUF4445 family)